MNIVKKNNLLFIGALFLNIIIIASVIILTETNIEIQIISIVLIVIISYQYGSIIGKQTLINKYQFIFDNQTNESNNEVN